MLFGWFQNLQPGPEQLLEYDLDPRVLLASQTT